MNAWNLGMTHEFHLHRLINRKKHMQYIELNTKQQGKTQEHLHVLFGNDYYISNTQYTVYLPTFITKKLPQM